MDGSPKTALPIPTAHEFQERLEALSAQVMNARALRETAGELRQYNAELRELLLEARLTALSRYERWLEDWLDGKTV